MKPTLILFFTALFLLTTANLHAQLDPCGDFDNNGLVTVTDLVQAVQYLYDGAAPPVDFDQADFDLHQKLTYRDIVHVWQCVAFCDFWNVQCPPTMSPFVPPVDSSFKIVCPEAVPANNTKYAITLRTSSTGAGALAFSYPIRFRIDGAIPVIDSVEFPIGSPSPAYVMSPSFINNADGVVTLVGLRTNNGPAYEQLAKIYVSIPVTSDERPITWEWAMSTPVQAPAGQENSVFPIVAREAFQNEVEPIFDPVCCNVPGDADNNGFVSISDAIYHICFIFGGCHPGDDWCIGEGDADGNGIITIADAVYIINFVFANGPAPVCS